MNKRQFLTLTAAVSASLGAAACTPTVRGRHDPPVAEQARVGLMDLIRGRAFERRIPLPKGTPVNLTLDTSLNFDELLAAYLDLNRQNLERSEPVQSPGGN